MSESNVKEVVKTEEKTRQMPMYRVILHNDDVNDMAHVCRALIQTFSFSTEKAYEVMQEAHETGVALCEILPLEYAEIKKSMLNSFSLSASIEPC